MPHTAETPATADPEDTAHTAYSADTDASPANAAAYAAFSYLVVGPGAGAAMGVLLLAGSQPTELASYVTPAAVVGAIIGGIVWPMVSVSLPRLEMPVHEVRNRLASWALLGAISGATIGLIHLSVGEMFGFTFLGFFITSIVARIILGTRLRPIFENDFFFNIARTGVITVALSVGIAHQHNVESDTIRDALNLHALPKSVQRITCQPNSFPDYSASCEFTVSPKDVDSLLAGQKFQRDETCRPTSHQSAPHDLIGEDVPVSQCYSAAVTAFEEVQLHVAPDHHKVALHRTRM